MQLDPSSLQFTSEELLADIGAKQLVIQRQAARIAELEQLLEGRNAAKSIRAVDEPSKNGAHS